MMTSSNGNSFRVTGPLCREFTGHRPHNLPNKITTIDKNQMVSGATIKMESYINSYHCGLTSVTTISFFGVANTFLRSLVINIGSWSKIGLKLHTDGSVQDGSISIANALEIQPSCTKTSITRATAAAHAVY